MRYKTLSTYSLARWADEVVLFNHSSGLTCLFPSDMQLVLDALSNVECFSTDSLSDTLAKCIEYSDLDVRYFFSFIDRLVEFEFIKIESQ